MLNKNHALVQDENLPCCLSATALKKLVPFFSCVLHSCFIHCSFELLISIFDIFSSCSRFPDYFFPYPWKALFSSSSFTIILYYVKVSISSIAFLMTKGESFSFPFIALLQKADRKGCKTQIFNIINTYRMKTCVVTPEITQWKLASAQKPPLTPS